MIFRAAFVVALLALRIAAATPACTSLELVGPGAPRGGAPREIPIYLAIPDSLGPFAVRPFLIAPPESAKVMLARAENGFQVMRKPDRRLLRALRIWLDGDARGAGEEIAALLPFASPALRPILKTDKAL